MRKKRLSKKERRARAAAFREALGKFNLFTASQIRASIEHIGYGLVRVKLVDPDGHTCWTTMPEGVKLSDPRIKALKVSFTHNYQGELH